MLEGETLIVPVKFSEAYNGLLKSVSNLSDSATMLQRMYSYSRLNPQMKAVVDKLFLDNNLTEEDLASDAPFKNVKDGQLLQSILKGFENYKVDYIFNERDSSGNLLVYTASERDDINSQLDEWSQAYIAKKKQANADPQRIVDLLEVIKSIKEVRGDSSLTNDEVYSNSRKHSQELFDLTGIRLAPLYFTYSWANSIKSSERTPMMQNLAMGYKRAEAIGLSFLDELYRQFNNKAANIFSKGKTGMASRLALVGLNNAVFDETIGSSTYVNPNGDLVYAHQLPTYHLKAINALNNPEKLAELAEDPYLVNNFLLNSPAFQNLSKENRLSVIRIAGSKIKERVTTEADGQSSEDILNETVSKNKATQSFGEFTPQEFALSLINNYIANFNRRTGDVKTVDSFGGMTSAIAPVFIRVLEGANTGDLVPLPVIKAVTLAANGNVELTPEIINIFIDRLSSEFSRINREAIKFDNEGPGIYKGYNDLITGRAFEFTNDGLMINGVTQEALTKIAIEQGKRGKGITFEQAVKAADNVSMSSIRTQVKNYLNESFNEFDQLITELKVKDNLSTQIIEGLSSGQEAADSVELAGAKLNLIDNTSHNLQQIFFSNWANSKSINDLLLGDQAVSLKSMVDKVKRAKLSNAAFYSAKSELTSKKLGIKHPSTNFDMIIFDEPLAKSSLTNADIEQADAQVYITTKGIRYATFAFGRLSDGMANMLNTIDAGVKVNSDRIYGSKENTINLSSTQDLLNSKKYVYMNGQTAIKMSVSVLTKEYTSKLNQNTGKWEAKPNMEELHYLREQMESNEEKNQNFAMAGPLSAVKMMKTNVNPLLDDNSGFDQSATLTSVNLETEYLGLQVVNPSNKKEVTDMTQIKEMISSEQDDFVEIPGMGLNEKGEVMKVGDVRRLYNDAIGSRVIIKYKNKRNLVFTFDTALDEFKLSKEKGAITPNLAAFLNYAQTALQSSGTSSTLLEFFSLENGSQKYNLNSPITEKKFAQLFLTYFSKGTLSEKVPGDSFSLVSSFGHKIYRRVFEIENGVPTRSEIIREDQWEGGKPTQNLGDLTNNNIPKEGIVVLDVLRTGVMEYINGESTGLRYSEVIMPPMDKNIMDLIAENPDSKIPDAIAKMFGVRIPSQDKHSAVNMRVVDFMPAYYGSSAIFPKELVEISGADFDIDKVYALMKQYYLNSKKEFVEYGTNNDYFEYIKYTNLEAGKSGSIISDAASLFEQDALAIRQENSLTDAQVKISKS